MPDARKYRFAHWHFLADSGDLSDGQAVTRLEPRVAALLEYFLTHQNTVISRDELVATVWESRSVSDDAINRCVSILRQLLSPEDRQRYIETVVRKGYIAHFPAAPEVAAPSRRFRGRAVVLAAIAGALATLLVYLNAGDEESSAEGIANRVPGPPFVAVLPFVSLDGGDESAFFAEGMREDLLTQLSKIHSLRVISGTSTREYRDAARNLREIGAELGADVIMEGSVQVAGSQMRVNAQLIDARTDEHLWAQEYDRNLTIANVFDIQAEIARAIAREMQATLNSEDRRQLAIIPTESMAAYRAYHRAMRLREADYSAIDSQEYQEALEEAVRLDPGFTRAMAELVSTLAFRDFNGHRPDLTARAEGVLEQLAAVAPGSADHLIGQAAYVYYALRDYDQAHDILTQALRLNPSDVNAMRLKSWVERRQGDFDAYVQTRYETRQLDPRDPLATTEVLLGLIVTHRHAAVRAELAATPVKSFFVDYTRAVYRFGGQGDFAGLQAAVEALCARYQRPECGWEILVANRDYPAALEVLESPDAGEHWPTSETARRWMFTHWLMGMENSLQRYLPDWREQLLEELDVRRQSDRYDAYLGLAILAGIEGNSEESISWIRQWDRHQPVDWAERAGKRHEVCRIVGMLGEAHLAAQCIRDGLTEPSQIMYFLEPALPFYDPVRSEPEFIQMVADLPEAEASGAVL